MRTLLVAMAAIITVSACTDRRASVPSDVDTVYRIKNDGGGQFISAEADRAMLLAWGGPVEIHGKCASACVIFTTLPNACMTKGSWAGFHGGSVNIGPIGWRQMAKYLRGDARAMYESTWRHIPQDEIHRVNSRDYQVLDPAIKICGE